MEKPLESAEKYDDENVVKTNNNVYDISLIMNNSEIQTLLSERFHMLDLKVRNLLIKSKMKEREVSPKSYRHYIQ